MASMILNPCMRWIYPIFNKDLKKLLSGEEIDLSRLLISRPANGFSKGRSLSFVRTRSW